MPLVYVPQVDCKDWASYGDQWSFPWSSYSRSWLTPLLFVIGFTIKHNLQILHQKCIDTKGPRSPSRGPRFWYTFFWINRLYIRADPCITSQLRVKGSSHCKKYWDIGLESSRMMEGSGGSPKAKAHAETQGLLLVVVVMGSQKAWVFDEKLGFLASLRGDGHLLHDALRRCGRSQRRRKLIKRSAVYLKG